jgi:hypothetical protein
MDDLVDFFFYIDHWNKFRSKTRLEYATLSSD